MRTVAPQVMLVARPQVDFDGMRAYLDLVDETVDDDEDYGSAYRWVERPLPQSDGEVLIEFGGRLRHQSWEADDSRTCLGNILHTEPWVMAHAQYTFAIVNVSRVFMHRFAPEQAGTSLAWSANIRTLRCLVQARTGFAANDEVRVVFHQLGEVMRKEAPALFGDFEQQYHGDNPTPAWVPANRKV